MSKTPQLRMDRSRPYSTVHGERVPGDPHAAVHFYQDGLPYNSHGVCLPEAIQPHEEAATRLYDKRLRKATGGKSVPVPAPKPAPEPEIIDPEDDNTDTGADGVADGAGDDDDVDDPATPDDTEVNLESWLRGEAKYPWFGVKAAITKRFAKQVGNQADAVVFLVGEGVATPEQVGKSLAGALN